MPALYRAADALVFPSVKEGFGLVVLEAMASGVPVVTSRIAPFTEYLGDGDVAVVRSARCRLRSPHAMAAALDAAAARRLDRRAALRSRRGTTGAHAARAHLAGLSKR